MSVSRGQPDDNFDDLADRERPDGVFAPRFDEAGLLPVFVTDSVTGEALMQAWMNRVALERTMSTGVAHYFSRSRSRIWKKGEESGHIQLVHEVRIDCDQDALLLKVEQKGGAACHTGFRSCFYRALRMDESGRIGFTEPDSSRVFDPRQVYSPNEHSRRDA
ncbi:MAG: phosphoribosyl-AMP cyclohydrolase [Spirochaetales bacterium]